MLGGLLLKKSNSNTFFGLPENLEAFLCYLLGWVTGILFLLFESRSKFVKFHAMQSVLVFLPLFATRYIVGIIPIIGSLLMSALNFVMAVLWVLLMYKAYRHKYYKLPVIGNLAEQMLN
jgi:uncharacterized membrane protein